MNKTLVLQSESILEEKDKLAALCNITSLLFYENKDLNWLGFYFFKDNELVLGPFQGKVACTHLSLDKGVCAAAFNKQEILNVKNVHEFAGHIACDSASNSELVIPLTIDNKKIGVLDIDSPILNRFSQDDEETFLEIAKLITNKIAEISYF